MKALLVPSVLTAVGGVVGCSWFLGQKTLDTKATEKRIETDEARHQITGKVQLSKQVWELSTKISAACIRSSCVSAQGEGSRSWFAGAILSWGAKSKSGKITEMSWKNGKGSLTNYYNHKIFAPKNRKALDELNGLKEISEEFKKLTEIENDSLSSDGTPYVFDEKELNRGYQSVFFYQKGDIKKSSEGMGAPSFEYKWGPI